MNASPSVDTDAPRSIPRHLRRNYEATDEALSKVEGLYFALDMVVDELSPHQDCSDKKWSAFVVLLDEIGDRLGAVRHLRSVEWVGIGGKSEEVTEAEAAMARGEV